MTSSRALKSLASVAIVLMIVLAWLPGVLASPLPVPQRATVNVSMVDNAFQPQSITIQVGDTVVWRNNGVNPHTSTSDTPGLWDSGIMAPGATFSRTFDTAGTFGYNCTLHRSIGMVGTVVVQAAAQATATTAPAQPTATSAPAQPTATAAAPTATTAPAVPTATTAAPTATAVAPAAAPTIAPTVAPTTAPALTQPAPAGAPPTLRILTPENCSITNFDINIDVETTNFTFSEGNIGKANQPGQGHYALYIDGQLRQQVAVSGINIMNLAPGPHTIRVQLVNNDNTPLNPPVEATVNIAVRAPDGTVTLPAACAPEALPKAGDSSLPPWVLLVAGAVIVVGLAVRTGARR